MSRKIYTDVVIILKQHPFYGNISSGSVWRKCGPSVGNCLFMRIDRLVWLYCSEDNKQAYSAITCTGSIVWPNASINVYVILYYSRVFIRVKIVLIHQYHYELSIVNKSRVFETCANCFGKNYGYTQLNR